MKSKLVLFDIDQTLVSNSGASRLALYQALQECLLIDISQLEAANIRLSGKTDPQIVREFMTACNYMNSSESERFWRKKISETVALYLQFLPQFLDKVVNTNKFFMHEGVEEILTVLEKDEKVALGLLTGNVERGARIKLEYFDLNRFFPIGAYGSDSASRLDLPAIAHERGQQYYKTNWLPSEIIIVGDAENDILCAKHYGATSLAVNTGTTSWNDLSKHQPDYIFSSLKNTSQILEAIMAGTETK